MRLHPKARSTPERETADTIKNRFEIKLAQAEALHEESPLAQHVPVIRE